MITKLKVTNMGKKAYHDKLVENRERGEAITIIRSGICPMCGSSLTKVNRKWLKIFDYDYYLECPKHGRLYEDGYESTGIR